jgi:hypothetical protein
MLATVAVAASVNGTPGQAHVSCAPCWWGEEVPEEQALAVAAEHEASREHLDTERADLEFELLAERVSVERGY